MIETVPSVDPRTLGTYEVTHLARVRPTRYWLDERQMRPEHDVEIVVPVIGETSDKLRIVVGDTNVAIAIWIPKSDVRARWRRSSKDSITKERAPQWHGGTPVIAGACLFTEVAGKVIGVVLEDVHYMKSMDQGWSSIAVYSPLGIIPVMAFGESRLLANHQRTVDWQMCR